jgi:hypothetical protein
LLSSFSGEADCSGLFWRAYLSLLCFCISGIGTKPGHGQKVMDYGSMKKTGLLYKIILA